MKALKLLVCLFLTAFLSACGAAKPVLAVPLSENIQAVYRVDIVGGGHGSGTVISHEGHILTAAHVVGGYRHVAVAIDNGGPYAVAHIAKVVFADDDTDLAVLKIDRHFDRVARLGSEGELEVGAEIYTVGYSDSLGQMYHNGTVSSVGFDSSRGQQRLDLRNIAFCNLTTAPGDSGGGVFAKATGHLVGTLNGAKWLVYGPNRSQFYDYIQPIDKVLAALDEHQIPYNEP